jgi:flagellar biosynthesis protein FlhG
MLQASDQAATLRAWAQQRTNVPMRARNTDAAAPRVVAIGGGKGGVGKTVFCANLACALGHDGARVLAVDADLGLCNLDFALGTAARHSVSDVLCGDVSIEEALIEAAPNVKLLAGPTGKVDMADLAALERQRLTDAVARVDDQFDVVLVDMASGIGDNVMHFARAAERVVAVATPDPCSLTDAYTFIKALRVHCGIKEVHFVANMVRNEGDGERLYGRLAALAERFIGVDLRYLGSVAADRAVPDSVRRRRPFVLAAPESRATRNVSAIVHRLRLAHGLPALAPMGAT